jgi:DNA-binding PadR family transcriptional regulator
MAGKKTNLDDLLRNWEEVYKKGLLTFWLLLFLHERPAYAYEAGDAVGELSQGTVTADENSMYRALNRLESIGVVSSELRDSSIGPQRRYYRLTEMGISLLARFIQRNILVFNEPAINKRIQAVAQGNPSEKKEA